MSNPMTKKDRDDFIKNKIAPVFDGMNANDVLEIINDNINLREIVFSIFVISKE